MHSIWKSVYILIIVCGYNSLGGLEFCNSKNGWQFLLPIQRIINIFICRNHMRNILIRGKKFWYFNLAGRQSNINKIEVVPDFLT